MYTCKLYLQKLYKFRVIFQMNSYPNLFINNTMLFKTFEDLKANTEEKERI